MANRQARRHPPKKPLEDGLIVPPGQWTNAQRDEIILGLATILRGAQDVMNEDRGHINDLYDKINEHNMRLDALEGDGSLPKNPKDELLLKVMGSIAALPHGFHFNAKNIADTIGADNAKVHQKIMVLVRAGKVTQHKQDRKTASFTIAPKDD